MSAPLHASPSDGLEVDAYGFHGLAMIGQTALPQQVEVLRVCEALRPGSDPVPTVRAAARTPDRGTTGPTLGQLELVPRAVATHAGSATAVGVPAYRSVVVAMGRRAAKSSSLWGLALGRCDRIAGYQVFVSLQSGIKGRSRFLATCRLLETYDPGGIGVRYRALKGAGTERIEWANGSALFVVPPKAESFRSEGAHLVILDEAQEHDPETSADLVAGALPLLDTEPAGQVIVSGTARADTRSGILWDYLAAAREHPAALGIVEYGAREDADLEDVAVWCAAHPGPDSGLTPLEVLRERRTILGADRFRAEYLGVWGYDASTAAIDAGRWSRLAISGTATKRPAVGLVFVSDCAPDGSRASVVCAWLRPDGSTVVELVDHRPGTAWVARMMLDLSRANRGCLLAWDNIGENIAAMAPLARVSPKPRTYPLTFDDVKGATSGFLQRVGAGTIAHLSQPDLDTAVEGAALRAVGESRTWARRGSSVDVTAVVAASLASWVAAKVKPPARPRIRSANPAA